MGQKRWSLSVPLECVHPGRACRDRARGRATGLHRRVVIRGRRGRLLHAAGRRRARDRPACGHGDRERLHARTSHPRHHGRRHGGDRARTILPRRGRRFGADRGSLERRPLRPPRHPRPRDGAVPPLRADRRARGVPRQDVLRRRLPPDVGRRPQPVPIHVAALRPGMLRVAGEVGDGVVLNWLSPDDVPKAVAVVREAAAMAGRDPQRRRDHGAAAGEPRSTGPGG